MKKTMIILAALLCGNSMLHAQTIPPSRNLQPKPVLPKYPDLVIASFDVVGPNAQGVTTYKYTVTNKGNAAANISGVMVNAYDDNRIALGGKDISQGASATLNAGQSVSGSFTSTVFKLDTSEEGSYNIELRVDEGKVTEVNECNNSKIYTGHVIR